jgi:hypothetical protein
MDKFMWWVREDGSAELVEVLKQVRTGALAIRDRNVYHLVLADELQKEHPYW